MKRKFTQNVLKTAYLLFAALILFMQPDVLCQTNIRSEFKIPDIPGYLTLKCDFHMHSVFSDGDVWPPVRAEEAWREGLDAFSITDHIDYLPFKDDIPKNLNRSYELSRDKAGALGILNIKAAEITHDMPPGHYNMLFLNDTDLIDHEDALKSLKSASDQGAFIIWNHPGWKQKDEIPIWYEFQDEVFNNGWMHGMEIVNYDSYYPLAFQWCIDKGITLIGGSDIHEPSNLKYDFAAGEHRPMTLVFAEERTLDSVKDALFDRRTAVYFANNLYGGERFLKPVFEESVTLLTENISVLGTGWANIQIHNASDIDYYLASEGLAGGLSVPKNIKLHRGKTILFAVRGISKTKSGAETVRLPFKVTNLNTAPDKPLDIEFRVTVTFVPDNRR